MSMAKDPMGRASGDRRRGARRYLGDTSRNLVRAKVATVASPKHTSMLRESHPAVFPGRREATRPPRRGVARS